MVKALTVVAVLAFASNCAFAADRLADTQLDKVTAGSVVSISCPGCSGSGVITTSTSTTMDGTTITTGGTQIIGSGGNGSGGSGGNGSGGSGGNGSGGSGGNGSGGSGGNGSGGSGGGPLAGIGPQVPAQVAAVISAVSVITSTH